MAYTKVFAIRARLDDRVKYAVNGEKTELDEKIIYTADSEKTETVRFVTALNCRSAETAFAAMQKTKKKYKKTGGVLGYHFIQSFAPGEVTPETMRSGASLHGDYSVRILKPSSGPI